MIAYKLVLRFNKKYESITAAGNATVYYKKKRINYPPEFLQKLGYGLCCFATEAAAIKYYERTCKVEDIRLWMVEGEKTKLLPFLFLCDLQQGIVTPNCQSFPKGTIMLKSVKFIKEVKINEQRFNFI